MVLQFPRVSHHVRSGLAFWWWDCGNNLPFWPIIVFLILTLVDPCGAILGSYWAFCIGNKRSTFAQGIVTSGNVSAMIFVAMARKYPGFRQGCPGYELSSGYFPYGAEGIFAGCATIFFAFIGFIQWQGSLGSAAALSICCAFYVLLPVDVVGMVAYYAMGANPPVSSGLTSNGVQWEAYIFAARLLWLSLQR